MYLALDYSSCGFFSLLICINALSKGISLLHLHKNSSSNSLGRAFGNYYKEYWMCTICQYNARSLYKIAQIHSNMSFNGRVLLT